VAMLSSPLTAYSWEGIFYTSAVLGFLWTFVSMLYGASDPESHKYISAVERQYIVDNRQVLAPRAYVSMRYKAHDDEDHATLEQKGFKSC
jgi:hypothetical protein